MAWFRTKEEKEIMAQMERDEQLEVFKEQMNNLRAKQEEYAQIAAEAEVNGDTATYDVACNALIDMNETLSSLNQAKANFDIINIHNSITTSMMKAMNALNVMANGKSNLKIREIQKINARLQKYMRETKVASKAMAGAMRTSNPANKARTDAEMANIRPMIDAARAKITAKSMPKTEIGLDIGAEIENEKNRMI